MKKYKYEPVGTMPKVGDVVHHSNQSGIYRAESDENETIISAGVEDYSISTKNGRSLSPGSFTSGEWLVVKRKSSRVRKPKVKSSETILEEAQRLTSGDRNADYGHPLDDYSKTGMIWGALLHKWSIESAKSKTPIPVPPELACLCMTGVKLSREVNKSKRDNLVDGAGYLRLVEMIQDERKKRNDK